MNEDTLLRLLIHLLPASPLPLQARSSTDTARAMALRAGLVGVGV